MKSAKASTSPTTANALTTTEPHHISLQNIAARCTSIGPFPIPLPTPHSRSNPRPTRTHRQHLPQITRAERNASLGRRIPWPRQMHENRTAAAALPWPLVMRQHHDQIVHPISSPQSLRTRWIGQRHGAIVVAVRRRITPAIASLDRLNRQSRTRTQHAVASIQNFPQFPPANRSSPVALSLDGPPPRASECTGKPAPAHLQPPAPAPGGQSAHDQDDTPHFQSFHPIVPCSAATFTLLNQHFARSPCGPCRMLE